MGIRFNNLVRASVSKIALAWHANPDMPPKAELAKEKALLNAYMNAQQ